MVRHNCLPKAPAMNNLHPQALETRTAPSSGGRLDKLFRLGNVVGAVTIIPAFFYPYLLVYFLLLLGIAIALAAFLLVIQMPVLAVARVMERAHTEPASPGKRIDV